MSSKEEDIIAKEQNHMIEYRVANNDWLKSVITKKRFDMTNIIDKGIVTAKLGVKLPKSGEDITVIVWKEDYIGNRLTPCMTFQHKNVMPLLHIESIPSLNAVLIYSISPDSNLLQKINSKKFRCAKNSLTNLVQYIKEVTDGLNYLHEKGYAHLNVKPRSISVFKDESIKVDQLHFVSSVNSNSTRNGLPQSLCPPETYYDKKSGYKYPKQFDSWAVGIMIVELFTGGYLTKKLPKYADSWCLQVYPIIFKILKKKKFDKHVHRHFPGACKRINLNYIRYLISNILTLHPNDRPTIEDIHKKLSSCIIEKGVTENTESYSVKPKIWKKRMYWTELMTETAQVTLKAQKDLNEKLIRVDESVTKINDKNGRLTAKTLTQNKQDVTEDPYRALREEILKYYGIGIPKVSASEPIECSNVYEPCKTNLEDLREKEFKREKEADDYTSLNEEKNDNGNYRDDTIRENIECSKVYEPREDAIKNLIDKEFKTEEECANYTTLNEKNTENVNAGRGNMFSRLMSFGTSTLIYLSDPWNPENPDTYLNKLSKKLTR